MKTVKKVLLFATIVVLGLAIITVALYSPVLAPRVNRYLQTTLQRTLEQQFQREVAIGDVRLTLPNPHLRISDLAIARNQQLSEGHLLSAATVSARILLRSLFARQIIVDKIRLEEPAIWVEFDQQGRSNLPDFGRGQKSSKPEKPRLRMDAFVRRLTFPHIELSNAKIHFVHQQLALRVDIEQFSTTLSLDLQELTAQGTIQLEGGEFDWQQRGPIATSITGALAFHEHTLTLTHVDIQANATHLTLNGTLTNLARPDLDLSVQTHLKLEELDHFLRLNQNLSGMVAFDGTVTGTIPDIMARGQVTCDRGTAWKLDFANVSTDAVYHQAQVLIEDLRADILGGHVEGSGALNFTAAPAYQANLNVERLNVTEANRFVERIVLPLAGWMSGTLDVRSETFAFKDLVLRTALQVENVEAYGVHVPQGELQVDIQDTTLSIRDLVADVFQGSASGGLQMNLSATPDYHADLELQDVHLEDLMMLLPQPPRVAGSVSGRIAAGGATYQLKDLVLQADLNVRDLTTYGMTAPQLDTNVTIEQSVFSLNNLSANLFDGRLEGQGHLVLAGDNRPKFNIQAVLHDIASRSVIQQLVPQASEQSILFDGRISGDVGISGNAFAREALTGHVRLTGEGTAASQAGHVPVTMQVESALKDDRIAIAQLEVVSQALQLNLSGALNLDGSDLQIQYDVASTEVAELLNQVLMFLPGLREKSPLARFSGTLEHLYGSLRGSVGKPEVQAEVHVAEADLVWAQADDVQASLFYDGDRLQIEDGQARYQSAKITVTNAEILLNHNGGHSADTASSIRFNLPITVHAAEISDYLAMAKQTFPVEGDLQTITATLQGPLNQLEARFSLDISKGVAWNQSFDSLTGIVALEGDRLALQDLMLKKNGGRLALDGFVGFDSSFEASLKASELDFRDLDVSGNVAAHYAGRVDISLEARGTFDDPDGKASIRLKDLVYRDTPIEDVTCEVTMEDRTIQAKLVAFRQKFITTFHLALNNTLDYQAELLMEQAAIEQILSLATEIEGITGIITGTITSEGSLKDTTNISATVKLSELKLDILGKKVRNVNDIDFVITPERFMVNSLDMRGNELGLFAQGSLDFGGAFDLAVDGAVDLRPFVSLLPPEAGISGLAGHLQLICNIRGTFLQPKIEGVAEITQGSLQLLAYPDPIKNIRGKIAFVPGNIKVVDLQGNVGGGNFETTGTIAYDGTGLQTLQINVTGKQIAVNEAVNDLTMTVSPRIQLAGDLTRPKMTGEVLIHKAVYSQDLDLQSLVTNKNRKISIETAQQGNALGLDLFIRAPRDIQIRNRFAEIDLRADLRVQGDTAAPQIEGRVEILSGNVQFGDITYRILSGVLDFVDPLRLNPEINIQAETTIQEYTISLGITGTLDEIQLDLESDPALSQVQITRLLAAGTSSGTNGYDFVTKPLQTLVEGELGKALRLDRFSVDVDPLLSGEQGTETSPSVTLGKRLFGDLLVTFTTTVGGSETSQVVEIEYRLSDRLSLIASRNEKGEIDTSFTFKFKLDEK